MSEPGSGPITLLLDQARGGESGALEALFDQVYPELRKLAHSRLRGNRRDQTISTTALVSETYLKMAQHLDPSWTDRVHFFASAATVMRHVLVDYVRSRSTEKRGGDRFRLDLDQVVLKVSDLDHGILDLDQALHGLEEIDPRLAKVVELKFFGGLHNSEIGALLEMSPRTVNRDWQKAKAYLEQALA